MQTQLHHKNLTISHLKFYFLPEFHEKSTHNFSSNNNDTRTRSADYITSFMSVTDQQRELINMKSSRDFRQSKVSK